MIIKPPPRPGRAAVQRAISVARARQGNSAHGSAGSISFKQLPSVPPPGTPNLPPQVRRPGYAPQHLPTSPQPYMPSRQPGYAPRAGGGGFGGFGGGAGGALPGAARNLGQLPGAEFLAQAPGAPGFAHRAGGGGYMPPPQNVMGGGQMGSTHALAQAIYPGVAQLLSQLGGMHPQFQNPMNVGMQNVEMPDAFARLLVQRFRQPFAPPPLY